MNNSDKDVHPYMCICRDQVLCSEEGRFGLWRREGTQLDCLHEVLVHNGSDLVHNAFNNSQALWDSLCSPGAMAPTSINKSRNTVLLWFVSCLRNFLRNFRMRFLLILYDK